MSSLCVYLLLNSAKIMDDKKKKEKVPCTKRDFDLLNLFSKQVCEYIKVVVRVLEWLHCNYSTDTWLESSFVFRVFSKTSFHVKNCYKIQSTYFSLNSIFQRFSLKIYEFSFEVIRVNDTIPYAFVWILYLPMIFVF